MIAAGILAGGGYYLYDASEQRDADYNYQPARDPSLPERVENKPQPEPYQPNCQNPQSREDADLCAQWAAVEQVTEANRLSSRALQLSVGALIFTVIGTGLLVWTLDETRQTARRELRAYVSTRPYALESLSVGQHPIFHILQKNGGQTPAYDSFLYGWTFYYSTANLPLLELPVRQPLDPDSAQIERSTLHAQESPMAGVITSHAALTQEQFDGIMAGELILYVAGIIEYTDTFGRKQSTEFCYSAGGGEFVRAWKASLANPNKKIEIPFGLAGIHNRST
ncbi:MAG: hypothetical protein RLN87_14125 [Parasphingopyxis sp.]